jgi:Spy/CpxP family protein refolding chaperone
MEDKMNKEKSIFTILIIIVIGLLFLGARTYYGNYGHMIGGMHGGYNTGQTGNYRMHGHGIIGAGMMNFGHGMMGNGMGCYTMGSTGAFDYYLYNKEFLNLSKNQIETLESLRNRYYEENLTLRTELYEKNFELEKLLYEENVNLSKAKSLTKEIGTIKSKLRYSGIESFIKARNVLTEEQINKLNTETFRGHMH